MVAKSKPTKDLKVLHKRPFMYCSSFKSRAGKLNEMVIKRFNHEYRRNFFTNVIVTWFNKMDKGRNSLKIGVFKKSVMKMIKKEIPNVHAYTKISHQFQKR